MRYQEEQRYEDIINLPHHVSTKRPHMSALDRAAQFSPFAALTGHAAAIKESARMTEAYVELDGDQKEELDRSLQEIRMHISKRPQVRITYFVEDEKKAGGAYVTVEGRVKKLDEYAHTVVFEDGSYVTMQSIYTIEKTENTKKQQCDNCNCG